MEKGAKDGGIAGEEDQLLFSNLGVEMEEKSGVMFSFRNLLWPWIKCNSATQSHVQHIQSSFAMTKHPIRPVWDHLFL